ncbi:MAG: glucosaminidase domain-containing protein [Bacteroidales bacterium]|jgi:LysM repeat protein|nr:glucosaminidase domain-containing protein [Bacteroidales bacterium]
MNYLQKGYLTLLILTLTSAGAIAQRISRTQYIETYKELAIKNMTNYGIPASITLAQACLESGDGNSRLAKEGNNHFGIKCHNWEGKRIYHDDDERNECFRKYNAPEESFRDHSEFLRFRDRYKFLFDIDPGDYKAWAYGLKRAGYATNPSYPQLLIKIIEDFKLYEYDVPGVVIPPPPSVLEKEKVYTIPQGTTLYQISLSRKILEKNGVPYIISQEGETWESIASEFNLFKRELQRFNDAPRDSKVEPGTIVYIEQKKKRADALLTNHVTEVGETIRELSQRYAIRAKNLRRLNNLKTGEEPAPGIILKLR